jgi:hypothetical protein
MSFTPLGFTTGTFVVVAGLGLHDAEVTLCQGLEARITESLVITFTRFAATFDTVNLTGIAKFDSFTEILVEWNELIIQF